MGEATRDKYNPAYNHLVSLLDECQQKNAPGYVINGINKALRLIEVRILLFVYFVCCRHGLNTQL